MVQPHFGRLMREGRKAGVVREDISAELMTEIILAAVERIMTPPKMAELEITPKTGFSAIVSVILKGVIARNTLNGEQ
jgi:broad-specificity NMP kinase